MVEIDQVLDEKPAKALVKELAELRIRNLQAFRELKELNDHGKFRYEHPLICQFSLRQELITLYQTDQFEFMKDFARTQDNIRRYKSLLNRAKRTASEKERDAANLKKYQERESLMKEIVKSKS